MASTSRAFQPRPFSLERLESLLSLDGVTWRHDVDQSPNAALAMARFEASLGVKATFYVMARSPFYNPFSHHTRGVIREIATLGHRLGVHCDLNAPRGYEGSPSEATYFVRREHEFLRAVTRLPFTRRVSFHRPPDCVLWQNLVGFESAYAPQWQGHYFADSRGAFLYGDPEDSDVRPLQINLHPEHWFAVDDCHEAFLQ